MYLDPKKQAMADLGIEDFNADEGENVYLEGKALMEFLRLGKISAKHEHDAEVKDRKVNIDQEKLAKIEQAIALFNDRDNKQAGGTDNQLTKAQQLKIKQQRIKESGRKSTVAAPIIRAGTRKQKPRLGFNTKQVRFLTIGLHPKLDTTGCLKHFPNISSANYAPQLKPSRNFFTNWSHSLRTQVFSKTLGHQVPALLKERTWRATTLGPAWYSLQGPLSPEEGGPCPGVAWSQSRRFPKATRNPIPGPGSHDVRPPKKGGYSLLPSFDWSPAVNRCAYSRLSFHLPPNIYNIRTPWSISTTTHPDYKVSKRGPYDVFTGPRDETTLYGFWAVSKFKGCKRWPLDPPSNIRSNDMQRGKFAQGTRFPEHPTTREALTDLSLCWKDPNAPGPAHYAQRTPVFARRPGKTYPFLSSQFHARPPPPFKVQPGPGRYDDDARGRCVDGHASVFKSKTPRGEWMVAPTLNSF